MLLRKTINASISIRLAAALGRSLAPGPGYRLADFIAARIAARRNSEMVRAMRANQWVVRGEGLDKKGLDQALLSTLEWSARSVYDLYHYGQDVATAQSAIVLDDEVRQIMLHPDPGGPGLMIAGLHFSGFDLIIQTLGRLGARLLVLTVPNPRGGQRLEMEWRRRTGLDFVPASTEALRRAIRHLQQGGIVLTGVDRPSAPAETRPQFFGHPANLPVHHVFLAAKARVPVRLMAANRQADGKYHVLVSSPIDMERHPDAAHERTRNAEKVLAIAETWLRRNPEQWPMSLPLWPELLPQTPT